MNDDSARDIEQGRVNNDIMLALGRIEGKMEGLSMTIGKIDTRIEDHETRIGKTEDTLYNIKIKIGLIGAVIGAIFSTVGNWIWHKIVGH